MHVTKMEGLEQKQAKIEFGFTYGMYMIYYFCRKRKKNNNKGKHGRGRGRDILTDGVGFGPSGFEQKNWWIACKCVFVLLFHPLYPKNMLSAFFSDTTFQFSNNLFFYLGYTNTSVTFFLTMRKDKKKDIIKIKNITKV